ncbi:MAG: hypothetical protein NVS3B15_13230 [Sediminibacterium sp.]
MVLLAEAVIAYLTELMNKGFDMGIAKGSLMDWKYYGFNTEMDKRIAGSATALTRKMDGKRTALHGMDRM